MKCCRTAIFCCFLLVCLVGCLSGCSASGSKSRWLFDTLAEADRAYDQSRWFEAGVAYQKILEKVPDDHYARFKLANALLRQDKTDAAIHHFGLALKYEPGHSKTYFNLSIAYVLMSIQALEHSRGLIRENDPGRKVIDYRIAQMRKLIDQPTDTTIVDNTPTIHFGGRRFSD